MWIDTHCHLDAEELSEERDALVRRALMANVSMMVIPSIDRNNFHEVRQLAHQYPNCVYAVGIHPVYVADATERDLLWMRAFLEEVQSDTKLVAIGEIGLDFYIPELKEGPLREKQEYFFAEQLRMAKDFNLPVLLHTRRAVDMVLKYLRLIRPQGGIAHAFNGSFQQALTFIELGFKLSFCGTFTYERAQHLKRLAKELPLSAIVVETDAPDLLPAWLEKRPNKPEELSEIGSALAQLREMTPDSLAKATCQNAIQALPKLKKFFKND